MLLLSSSFVFVLKVIIIRIFNDSFFVPEFSLVLRVSLCLGFKVKVNPYLCYQVLFDVITFLMSLST